MTNRSLFLLIGLLFSSHALSKVTQAQMERFGRDLTPMGAERSGLNDEGLPVYQTLPEYSGRVHGVPSWVEYKETGAIYPHLYPGEKPLIIITSENYKNHQAYLTPGTVALFEKYPASFSLPIYPSHRDGSYSQAVHQSVLNNAQHAERINDTGVKGASGGPPFPIPTSGMEILWNHLNRVDYPGSSADYNALVFSPSGDIAQRDYQLVKRLPYMEAGTNQQEVKPYLLLSQKMLFPPRRRGEITLLHDYADPLMYPRAAWFYNPGTRRVRRAPSYGYDSLSNGDTRTIDEIGGFNGSMERYNWSIVGKKALYIPYHNYDFHLETNNNVRFSRYHPNPNVMRYELHRTWIVEGRLKETNRHVYQRRVFYLDEDSWNIVYADSFAADDSLQRTQQLLSLYAYDLPGIITQSEVNFDLKQGVYVVDKLNSSQYPALRKMKPLPYEFFTPGNIRHGRHWNDELGQSSSNLQPVQADVNFKMPTGIEGIREHIVEPSDLAERRDTGPDKIPQSGNSMWTDDFFSLAAETPDYDDENFQANPDIKTVKQRISAVASRIERGGFLKTIWLLIPIMGVFIFIRRRNFTVNREKSSDVDTPSISEPLPDLPKCIDCGHQAKTLRETCFNCGSYLTHRMPENETPNEESTG